MWRDEVMAAAGLSALANSCNLLFSGRGSVFLCQPCHFLKSQTALHLAAAIIPAAKFPNKQASNHQSPGSVLALACVLADLNPTIQPYPFPTIFSSSSLSFGRRAGRLGLNNQTTKPYSFLLLVQVLALACVLADLDSTIKQPNDTLFLLTLLP